MRLKSRKNTDVIKLIIMLLINIKMLFCVNYCANALNRHCQVIIL